MALEYQMMKIDSKLNGSVSFHSQISIVILLTMRHAPYTSRDVISENLVLD